MPPLIYMDHDPRWLCKEHLRQRNRRVLVVRIDAWTSYALLMLTVACGLAAAAAATQGWGSYPYEQWLLAGVIAAVATLVFNHVLYLPGQARVLAVYTAAHDCPACITKREGSLDADVPGA